MKKNRFVMSNIEVLLSDPDIKKYLDSASSIDEKEFVRRNMESSLETAYDKYADEYFSTKGVGSYVSNLLRYSGAVADLAGTCFYWALPFGPGFTFKLAGMGAKSLADIIDSKHYSKHAIFDNLSHTAEDIVALGGESIIERAAAYTPFGVGEILDFVRGSKKYDNRVLSKALTHAKNEFIRKIGDYEPVENKVIRLDNFKHPYYSSDVAMSEVA